MEINTLHSNIDDYFISLVKDFTTNLLKLTIGMPKNWVVKSTKVINCEISGNSDVGQMVEISGIDNTIEISDLYVFANKLIDRNKLIELKEKEYRENIEKEKEKLKNETEKMYESLERMKDVDINFDGEDSDTDLDNNDDVSEDSDDTVKEKLEKKLS